MSRTQIKLLVVFALFACSSFAASYFTPRIKIADSRPKIDLETLFPRQFADWTIDVSTPIVLPSADVQARLDKIYNQVLSRTYIDSSGYRIMLSVAYGGDQSDGLSVHRPEICYPAQGFEVSTPVDASLPANGRTIPVVRLLTKLGSRAEPVTYWVVNGDKAVGRRFSARLVQLQYGLKGLIPDGMLIRVSSIDGDTKRAFAAQDRFAGELVSGVQAPFRSRLGAG